MAAFLEKSRSPPVAVSVRQYPTLLRQSHDTFRECLPARRQHATSVRRPAAGLKVTFSNIALRPHLTISGAPVLISLFPEGRVFTVLRALGVLDYRGTAPQLKGYLKLFPAPGCRLGF